MKKVFKRQFVLAEYHDNTWTIREFKNASIFPLITKTTAKEMVARLLQLLDLGPVAPQTEPERIELVIDETVVALSEQGEKQTPFCPKHQTTWTANENLQCPHCQDEK